MGEKYLGQLTAKSAPATGDILMLEDSEDTKKIDYDALANAILNKLTTKTYTVAGRTNTLIAAIDALNSNAYLLTGGTKINAAFDFDSLSTPGSYYVDGSVAATHSPVTTNITGLIKVEHTVGHADEYLRQTYYPYRATGGYFVRIRNNGTWGDWVQEPTRAEMDDQKSKFSDYKDITATTSNSGSISLAPLGVGAGSSLTSAYIRAEGATMDYTVLLLRTYSGNWYAKVINWDLTPVVNTKVTVRLVGTVAS